VVESDSFRGHHVAAATPAVPNHLKIEAVVGDVNARLGGEDLGKVLAGHLNGVVVGHCGE